MNNRKIIALCICFVLLTFVACSNGTTPSCSEDIIPSQSASTPPEPLSSPVSSAPTESSMSPSPVQDSSTPEHSQPEESAPSNAAPEANANPGDENQGSGDAFAMSSSEAYALYETWERNGYPDDVGGVYFDDSGMLGFLLVSPIPERSAELRSIAGDNIIITPCKYSYNELKRVHGEIAAEMGQNSKIYFVGIGFTSKDGIVTGFGESSKEFRVTVGVDESEYEHYNSEFLRRYDDMVSVEISVQATTR